VARAAGVARGVDEPWPADPGQGAMLSAGSQQGWVWGPTVELRPPLSQQSGRAHAAAQAQRPSPQEGQGAKATTQAPAFLLRYRELVVPAPRHSAGWGGHGQWVPWTGGGEPPTGCQPKCQP